MSQGKSDWQRPCNKEKFDKEFDRIFGKKKEHASWCVYWIMEDRGDYYCSCEPKGILEPVEYS